MCMRPRPRPSGAQNQAEHTIRFHTLAGSANLPQTSVSRLGMIKRYAVFDVTIFYLNRIQSEIRLKEVSQRGTGETFISGK